MKKILTLVVGVAALLASCEKTDEKPNGGGAFEFGTPAISAIAETSVKVSCPVISGAELLAGLETGFAYGAPDADEVQYTYVKTASLDGNALAGTLTGLTAATAYRVFAYAKIGQYTIKSTVGAFTTLDEGEVPPPPGEPAFAAPSSSDVSKNSATISCSYSYDGTEAVSEVYFLYSAASGSEVRANQTTAQGLKSAPLTGLTPSTLYTFHLCAVVGGKTFSSASSTFTTSAESGQSGTTVHSGWSELPALQDKSGDYYYAYHMRPDAKSVRNYSVCYSAKYRCAIWTAMPFHKCYTGSVKRTDAWQYDPEISSFLQPNLYHSYKATGDGSYSRGHMVASNERTVSVATNEQTFYYTNMSPQIQNGFNGGIWGTLEGLCDKVMCSDTLYVVTGSYFANESKTCEDNSDKKVTVPTHFYKVLIRSKSGSTKKPLWELSADQIQCAGWWMEHKVYSGSSSLKPYIKSVAEIEAITGQNFFPNVPNAPKSTVNASDWGL